MANPSKAVTARGPITHVIFDMDGLLLDTEKFYTEVLEIFLARYNKTFDWAIKSKMMGKKAIEAAGVFVEESGISDSLGAEQFLIERQEMLQKLLPTSELMPASRLTKQLQCKQNTNLFGNRFSQATFRIENTDILNSSLMHHFVLGDVLKLNKGGPIDPCGIIVFEDAPSGVLGAKSARMSVVMVPDSRIDKSFHDNADQILKSLLDFSSSDWDLPPFEDNEFQGM